MHLVKTSDEVKDIYFFLIEEEISRHYKDFYFILFNPSCSML